MKTPEVVNLSLDEKDLLLESLANETLSKEQREHLKAIVLSFTEETGLSPYLVPLSFREETGLSPYLSKYHFESIEICWIQKYG